MLCDKITVIVNDQKKKHNSKININTVKVGDGDSQKEIEKAKLKSHGIIAKDKSGKIITTVEGCLLYTSDAADEGLGVDL